MFQCFILHVTTGKNILQMFYAKTFAKILQNKCFSTLNICSRQQVVTGKIKHLQKRFRAVDFLQIQKC